MWFHQNKKLLDIKGNSKQSEKTIYRMGEVWENTCQLFTWWRTNILNIQQTQKFNKNNASNSIKNWQMIWVDISQKKRNISKYMEKCSISLELRNH